MQCLDNGGLRNRSHSELEFYNENFNRRKVTRPIATEPDDVSLRYWQPPDGPRQQIPLKYRPVCSRSDLIGAFALLRKRYEDAGLAEALPNQADTPRIRMMPFHGWRRIRGVATFCKLARATSRTRFKSQCVAFGRWQAPAEFASFVGQAKNGHEPEIHARYIELTNR